jgi:hypothetical protein
MTRICLRGRCRGDFPLDHTLGSTDDRDLAVRLAECRAAVLKRSGGEIGRRARLRIWFRKECGFESHPEQFPSPSVGESDEFFVRGLVKILFETSETFFRASKAIFS